jgi:putative oxidoreductase
MELRESTRSEYLAVLYLSIHTRAYDDRDFHLSSIAFALHGQSPGSSHALAFASEGRSKVAAIGLWPSNPSDNGRMELLQDLTSSGLGAALLRFILAGFWIAHWWYKVGYRGMAATEAFFFQQSLPAWLAWFDVGFEIVVAVCLILGFYVRMLCLLSLPILIASMWIYRKNGFYFSSGGIELPFFWALAQIAQALLGAGAFPMQIST